MITNPQETARGGETLTARRYLAHCAAAARLRAPDGGSRSTAPPPADADTAYLLGVVVAAGVLRPDMGAVVVSATAAAATWMALIVRRLGAGVHMDLVLEGRAGQRQERAMLYVAAGRIAVAALPTIAGGDGDVRERDVPPEHRAAFWRGVLDARGSITWTPGGLWQVAVRGDEQLAEQFRAFLASRGINLQACPRVKGQLSTLTVTGGADVRDTLRALYAGADAELAHPEKARIASVLTAVEGARERRRRVSPAWMRMLREAGAPEVEVAAFFGVSRMTIWRWRREEDGARSGASSSV